MTFIIVTSTIRGLEHYSEIEDWTAKSPASRETLQMHQVEGLFESHLRILRPFFPNNQFLVPFLPMTRQHVMYCVDQEAKRQLRGRKLPKEDIRLILDQLDYHSKSFPAFATFGCKVVKDLVNGILVTTAQM